MHFVELILALVSSPISVRENTAPITAILEPFPVIPASIRPDHVSSPCHLIIYPLSLIPANEVFEMRNRGKAIRKNCQKKCDTREALDIRALVWGGFTRGAAIQSQLHRRLIARCWEVV